MGIVPNSQTRKAIEKVRFGGVAVYGSKKEWELERHHGTYTLYHYDTPIVEVTEDGVVTLKRGYSASDRDNINSLTLLLLGKKVCRQIRLQKKKMLVRTDE